MQAKKYRFKAVAVAAMLGTCTACSSPTPLLDQHFGEAVSLITAQQVLHPDAGANRNPITGIDGVAGKSAYDEYQKSFRVPTPQPNSFTIGVGAR